MNERVEERLRDLARRAGLKGVSTRAMLAVVACAAVFILLACWRWWPRAETADPIVDETLAAATTTPVANETTSAATALYVHVCGAVRRPGVYELAPGSRIVDAIDAAGGLLGDAVAAAVNLARPVTDGEQVVVPSADDARSMPAVPGASSGTGGAASQSGAHAGDSAQSPIDLNTADAAALDTLPGVGPSTAEKIVSDREANGPFSTVEDLGRVSGIGPKKLEQLKGLVCVR